MKNKQTETKLRSGVGLTRHLISWVLCLAVIRLICSSASAQLPRAIVTDFNGDGKPDYLLYNVSTRQTAIWYLNNTVHIADAFGPTLPVGWELAGVADFNRDGHPDYLLFKTATRQTTIWYLNNIVHIAGAVGPTLPSGWEPVATGDFNKDGKPDWVLYNASTRQTALWYMNNNVRISAALGPVLPAGYSIKGVADFNRDGHADYALFNSSTGRTAIWYLAGVMRVGAAYGPTISGVWVWELVATADFNRDGKPDYVLYKGSTGQTAIWYLNNNVYVSAAAGPTVPPAGASPRSEVDTGIIKKPDYLLFNPSTRQSVIWYLSRTTRIGSAAGPTITAGYNLAGAEHFNGTASSIMSSTIRALAKQRFGT